MLYDRARSAQLLHSLYRQLFLMFVKCQTCEYKLQKLDVISEYVTSKRTYVGISCCAPMPGKTFVHAQNL